MNSWCAILAVLLGLAFPAGADLTAHLRTTRTGEYRVTYWTSEQGLPQNTVTCLRQTRDGYLWFGTRFGLVRHDGVRFQSFISDLPLADADGADVRGLAEDSAGRVWLHSGAGLASYHRGRFQFYPLKDAPFPGTIQSLCRSRSGGLWVAKRRGIVRVEEGHVTRAWGLEKELGWNRSDSHVGLGRISEDAAGRLWVQASDLYWNSWRRLDPRTGAVEDVTNLLASAVEDISALLEDRRGRLWLARPHELLCGESGRWTRFAVTNAWAGHKVRQLAEDREGRLWAVSAGPVQLHRFADGKFTSYGAASGLANPDDLRCVLPDQEGNVWVGSGSGGLNRLQPRPLVSVAHRKFLHDGRGLLGVSRSGRTGVDGDELRFGGIPAGAVHDPYQRSRARWRRQFSARAARVGR